MRISPFLILVILFAGLTPANFVCAAQPLDVVVSEICWMGTETSSADEWIELYNNTTSTIDITNWTLKSNDESPDITFQTEQGPTLYDFSIPAQGFYLLERTDDDAVMDIPANYIYTGALNNSGETLELRDAQGNLIDAVDCAHGWLFGDNATKQTMERKDFLLSADADNWQTSATPGGTPSATSSVILREPPSIVILREPSRATEESPGPTVDTEQRAEQRDSSLRSGSSPRSVQNDNNGGNNDQLSVINNQSSISFPDNIIINELLPSPDGPDAENEWIEIFNKNDFYVDISNWEITDTQGRTKSYNFPQNTIIKAKSFLLLPRPQTKITLNNETDALNLIQPNGTIIDSVVYSKAKLNQSYNRTGNNWVWSDTLTPGWENIASNATDNIKENSVSNADDGSNSKDSHSGHSEATPVSKTYRDRTAVNFPFQTQIKPIHFTASLLALFSAFSILALKRSISN